MVNYLGTNMNKHIQPCHKNNQESKHRLWHLMGGPAEVAQPPMFENMFASFVSKQRCGCLLWHLAAAAKSPAIWIYMHRTAPLGLYEPIKRGSTKLVEDRSAVESLGKRQGFWATRCDKAEGFSRCPSPTLPTSWWCHPVRCTCE